MTRIDNKFNSLKEQGKKAFVSYSMCGDMGLDASLALMHEFVGNGVDVIELGMPFSDPMAEGPVIQKAAERALKEGVKIRDVIATCAEFRKKDDTTPVILMGYFNPIFHYGAEKFVSDCAEAGVDGFIIVDLPPEEENELTDYLDKTDMSLIKLTTPTTDSKRAEVVLKNSGGFVYYVSVAGVTGVKEAVLDNVETQVKQLKTKTDLPICVGFGIKTPDQARETAKTADGIVIGSAFVKIIEENQNNPSQAIKLCGGLANSVREKLDS